MHRRIARAWGDPGPSQLRQARSFFGRLTRFVPSQTQYPHDFEAFVSRPMIASLGGEPHDPAMLVATLGETIPVPAIVIPVFVCAVFVAAILGARWGKARSRMLLATWAKDNHYQLLGSEFRYWRTGPFFWKTGRGQTVMYFSVRDAENQIRSGWIRCGSWLAGIWSDQVAIRWDDPAS
jgi:hypothetical protein